MIGNFLSRNGWRNKSWFGENEELKEIIIIILISFTFKSY